MNNQNEKTNDFLIKKHPLIRVVDFDGMGGKEYIYHCGNCKIEIIKSTNFCGNCGVKFEGVNIKDTWGL